VTNGGSKWVQMFYYSTVFVPFNQARFLALWAYTIRKNPNATGPITVRSIMPPLNELNAPTVMVCRTVNKAPKKEKKNKGPQIRFRRSNAKAPSTPIIPDKAKAKVAHTGREATILRNGSGILATPSALICIIKFITDMPCHNKAMTPTTHKLQCTRMLLPYYPFSIKPCINVTSFMNFNNKVAYAKTLANQ